MGLIHKGLTVFAGGAISNRCHGRAAFGHILMEGGQAFGHEPPFTHTFIGGRFDETVLELEWTDCYGRKGFGCIRHAKPIAELGGLQNENA